MDTCPVVEHQAAADAAEAAGEEALAAGNDPLAEIHFARADAACERIPHTIPSSTRGALLSVGQIGNCVEAYRAPACKVMWGLHGRAIREAIDPERGVVDAPSLREALNCMLGAAIIDRAEAVALSHPVGTAEEIAGLAGCVMAWAFRPRLVVG